MVHPVEMSHEEEVDMYMKLTKPELIDMLMEANRLLAAQPLHTYTIRKETTEEEYDKYTE